MREGGRDFSVTLLLFVFLPLPLVQRDPRIRKMLHRFLFSFFLKEATHSYVRMNANLYFLMSHSFLFFLLSFPYFPPISLLHYIRYLFDLALFLTFLTILISPTPFVWHPLVSAHISPALCLSRSMLLSLSIPLALWPSPFFPVSRLSSKSGSSSFPSLLHRPKGRPSSAAGG